MRQYAFWLFAEGRDVSCGSLWGTNGHAVGKGSTHPACLNCRTAEPRRALSRSMATREASRGRIMGGPTMPPGLAPLVWVVVLGDFGRSPRMMYHTLSLVEHGFRVHVLAHLATQPGAEFVENVEAGRVALHG